MTWQTFAFIAIAGATSVYVGLRVLGLLRLMRRAKLKAPRPREIKARILSVLVHVFGHGRLLDDKTAGVIHFTIFYGFLIITLGTLEQFVTTLHQDWNFEFIGRSAYSLLILVQDFFAAAVLGAALFALHRRVVLRIERLGKSKDALIILLFTSALMVSILFMNAFHILGHRPWYQGSMPFSEVLASALAILNLSPSGYSDMHTVFKWIHMLLVMGFGAYIPSSKHLHVLAAGPNVYFRTLTHEKAMSKINFEDESVTQYGAARVTDLGWKNFLDAYSCTECGRCQAVCPAWNTQKPLSPKNLMIDLKHQIFDNKAAIAAGTHDSVSPLVGPSGITEDVIWACTSCRACEIACPVFIEQTDVIFAARRNLVMMESKFPPEVQTVFKNMETNATPWAFSADDRDKWAEGLNIKTIEQDPSPEVLLWVGCAGSYDDRNKKVLRALASLMKKAGVRFAILGKKEKCTGDPARRIGNEYLFQQLATENVKTLNLHGVKRIVTSCPHCYNTLKNEYKDFGGNYEVYHHSQYLDRLLKDGKLRAQKNLDETVTFHDSCYMGRWNDEYGAPRHVLESVPGAKLVEMKDHGSKSMCCGAGGGRMWMEEKLGKRVNVTRTEQAIETKASVVASSCPFCMTMLTDGLKTKELSDKIKVYDLAEILDESTIGTL